MVQPVVPPLKPMLAKLTSGIPRGEGLIYEPKWDGFRAVVFGDGQRIELRSRNDRPMNRYFPEVEQALADALSRRCVVDGEIIMPTDAGLDFDALQMRLHPAASRVAKLAAETPASFVAFDLVAVDDEDLRSTPLSGRWDRLTGVLTGPAATTPEEPALAPGPRVWLTDRTTDPEQAEAWLRDLERFGLDGVIAKHRDLPYAPGERVMHKIKHRRTADCVVGGYRIHKDGEGVGSLLLGLHDPGGALHFVGHTSSFKARERRELLELLRPLERDGGFEGGRAPGEASRWSAGKDPTYVAVEPRLVCEVAYDHMQGPRFRHAATFLRWREDKSPAECTFDQVSR